MLQASTQATTAHTTVNESGILQSTNLRCTPVIDHSPSRLDQHQIQPTSVRVLLVDDDETWVESTARILEHQREQFAVETATTLATAITAISSDIDCIVCDYDLETGTGLDLLRELREDGDRRPFILITGQGNEDIASEAIGRQVTDYISKRSLGGQSKLLARRIESTVEAYRTRNALARERRSKDAMLEILRDTPSQDGLMQRFCNHISDEHDYACVWLGMSEGSLGVVPRAVAGGSEYLDAVLDPQTAPGDSTEPALLAFSQGESYSVEHIGQFSEPDNWATTATDAGFASAIATPICHDESTFGVLSVYDSRPGVSPDELALLEEYAETIGYALRTAAWKESLLSETPVEVEFEFVADRVPLVDINRHLPAGGRIEVLTRFLHDETLLYVLRLTGVSETEFEAHVPDLDIVEEAHITDSSGPLRVEVTVSRPTPETVVAAAGGHIIETVVEDGVAVVTASVSQNEAISSLTEALESTYPNVSVRSVRGADILEQPRGSRPILDSLTEKQRRALEVAYFSGYFQRPRDQNTSEVATKLNISRQTLSQHLRAGERKLLGTLFDSSKRNQER